jgi:hypothetical protein
MSEIVKIALKTKIVCLKLSEFNLESEIDLDSILKIAYHNIIGEILTFPVILNRIGNLQAEMDEALEATKLEIEIKKATFDAQFRKELIKKVDDGKGNMKTVYPTEKEIEASIILDPVYQNLQKKLIRVNKEKKNIDSFYWAAISKDNKLNKISEKLRPEEFENEIIEDTINGIQIKLVEKLIKD